MTTSPISHAVQLGRVGLWTNQLNSLTAAETRDVLQEVEDLGYGAIWFGETPRGREAFINAAIALGATNDLVVATGVASIWARDASATASAQQVLWETYPGRFLLGLGVSHEGLVRARGHDYDKPLSAMRSYLRQMDAHSLQELPPVPVAPPRVLGALGPAMLGLASREAHGAHPFLVTPDHTASAREALGPRAILAPEQGVLLERDAGRARDVLRSDMRGRLRLPNYRRSLERLGYSDDDLLDGGSDRLIDGMYAWGGEEDVARRVQEHLDAGADHVALYVLGHAIAPLDAWRRLAPLTRFAREDA